ncbi:MAG: hypothetical protein HGA62_05630 [Chlorobiaceae bacterium]|nr:hypothetical protein [Chlorobiaceae bacterium]NTV61762.1 hypothetical protein [Chlorobiaceae bacterium]
MLKDAAGFAGGALLLTPLGVPIFLHGVAGMLIGGAGLILADSFLKEIANQISHTDLPDAGQLAGQKEEKGAASGQ